MKKREKLAELAKKYIIYSVENYKIANENFIKENIIEFDDIKKLSKELKNDKSYHFRIHKNTNYIFFGDIDGYDIFYIFKIFFYNAHHI